MRNTFVGLAVASVLVAAPFMVSAQTTDILSQIQALLEQIKALQQKINDLNSHISPDQSNPGTQTSPVMPVKSRWCNIVRTLALGSQGNDVIDLQTFLKEEGYLGIEPTGYFGQLTANAVAKWQGDEGIDAVGSVGPISRGRITSKWCGGGGMGVGDARFSADPQKGDAPLTVVFSTWLGGYRGDRDTVSYTIDFGDGSTEKAANCHAPLDACQSAGQNKHTYSTNGTYVAALNKVIDPCAGQVACRAAIHSETIAKLQILVGNSVSACTKEYKPVCGWKQVQCIKAPCYPVQQTYGNECMMKADGATFAHAGACVDSSTNPADDPKCKAWYDGCNNCSRSTTGGPAMCTLRACLAGDNSSLVQGKAYCTAWFDGTDGNKPPVISSFSGPTTLAVNQAGTWSVNASDPENGNLSYYVTWGDEVPYAAGLSSSALAADKFVQTTTFTHSYSSAGTYTVGMTVRDSAGASARTSTTVKVGSGGIDCSIIPTTLGSDSLEWQQKCRSSGCTTEYAPVCGLPSTGSNCTAGSICAMVEPIPTTYSNKCMLNAAKATYLYAGVCKSTSACWGYDFSLKNTLRNFFEGETTQCIAAGDAVGGMSCIVDAHYACRSGLWKIEGGLPPATGPLSITSPTASSYFGFGADISVKWQTTYSNDYGMYLVLETDDGSPIKSVSVYPQSGSATISTNTFCNSFFSDGIDGDCNALKAAIAKSSSFHIRASIYSPKNYCFGFCQASSVPLTTVANVKSDTFKIYMATDSVFNSSL